MANLKNTLKCKIDYISSGVAHVSMIDQSGRTAYVQCRSSMLTSRNLKVNDYFTCTLSNSSIRILPGKRNLYTDEVWSSMCLKGECELTFNI